MRYDVSFMSFVLHRSYDMIESGLMKFFMDAIPVLFSKPVENTWWCINDRNPDKDQDFEQIVVLHLKTVCEFFTYASLFNLMVLALETITSVFSREKTLMKSKVRKRWVFESRIAFSHYSNIKSRR